MITPVSLSRERPHGKVGLELPVALPPVGRLVFLRWEPASKQHSQWCKPPKQAALTSLKFTAFSNVRPSLSVTCISNFVCVFCSNLQLHRSSLVCGMNRCHHLRCRRPRSMFQDWMSGCRIVELLNLPLSARLYTRTSSRNLKPLTTSSCSSDN